MDVMQHVKRQRIGFGKFQEPLSDIHIFTDRFKAAFMRDTRGIEYTQWKRQLENLGLQIQAL